VAEQVPSAPGTSPFLCFIKQFFLKFSLIRKLRSRLHNNALFLEANKEYEQGHARRGQGSSASTAASSSSIRALESTASFGIDANTYPKIKFTIYKLPKLKIDEKV
jgi:hypothetical protein